MLQKIYNKPKYTLQYSLLKGMQHTGTIHLHAHSSVMTEFLL